MRWYPYTTQVYVFLPQTTHKFARGVVAVTTWSADAPPLQVLPPPLEVLPRRRGSSRGGRRARRAGRRTPARRDPGRHLLRPLPQASRLLPARLPVVRCRRGRRDGGLFSARRWLIFLILGSRWRHSTRGASTGCMCCTKVCLPHACAPGVPAVHASRCGALCRRGQERLRDCPRSPSAARPANGGQGAGRPNLAQHSWRPPSRRSRP